MVVLKKILGLFLTPTAVWLYVVFQTGDYDSKWSNCTGKLATLGKFMMRPV